jgi:RND family efflux transporter MFP subunit
MITNMKLQFSQATGITFLTGVFLLTSCSGNKKEKELKNDIPVLVQLGTATQQSGEKITVSGQIESRETAVISTRIMGFISSVKVKPGDRVRKGQLLITISNGDVLAKRNQAEAMISEAEAALKDAQKDYERFGELYKQQSASTKEFENATLRYNSGKARAEAARQMKIEVDAMLSYTNLVAPLAGVITQKNIDEGSMANPGMLLLTIEKEDGYHVKAFVSESEIGKLKNGLDAVVTIKSTGKTFRGKTTEISPSSQFSGGQYQIKVVVPANETTGLFSGMYANVSIELKDDSGVQSLFVPASAIIHKDQLSGLYTVSEDQKAQLRWLKVGREYDDEVEILSGLNAGDAFITKSHRWFYSGAPVFLTLVK